MAYTQAKGRAVTKYMNKAYDEFKIRIKKGKKELIQSRAEELGKSVNSYITDLILDDLEQSKSNKKDEE